MSPGNFYGSAHLYNLTSSFGLFAKSTCVQLPQGQVSPKRHQRPSEAAQKRLKGEEGKHKMSTLPSSPSLCPSFLSENISKGSEIYFLWNLKWSVGLHHWAPGWEKGKVMVVSQRKGAQPSPWWMWDSQIRPGNSREGWILGSHNSQKLELYWGRYWSISEVKKPKSNKIINSMRYRRKL